MFTFCSNNDKEIVLKEFVTDDSDFEEYVGWLRDYDTVKYIGRREYLLAMQINSIYQYVQDLNESENDSFFKVFYKEKFIGTFKIGHINWETGIGDVGIMIGDVTAKGRGLSSRIVSVGMEYAFNILGLRKLVGGCIEKNIPMRKCFEKVGFEKEGCFRKQLYIEGEYQDHYFYGIFKEDFCK